MNLSGEWRDPNGVVYFIARSGNKTNVSGSRGGPAVFNCVIEGNNVSLRIPVLNVDLFKGSVAMQNGVPTKLNFTHPAPMSWTKIQPEPLATPKGRLYRDEGKYVFSQVTAEKEVGWVGAGRQKTNIKLTAKPELSIGPSGARYLSINLDGSLVSASSSGTLYKDNEHERGFYLEKVYNTIVPLSSKIALVKAADFSPEESGNVTSSTSTTFSLTGGGKAGSGGSGELSGSLGYSKTVGHTYSRNLLGFTNIEPRTSKDSRGFPTVNFDYKLTSVLEGGNGGLKPYTKWNDLSDLDQFQTFWDGFGAFFDTSIWYGLKLHGLPRVARSGLPLISQALFIADEGFSQKVDVYIGINAIIRRVWSSGDTKFDSKIHTSTHEMRFDKTMRIDFGLLK